MLRNGRMSELASRNAERLRLGERREGGTESAIGAAAINVRSPVIGLKAARVCEPLES